MQKNFRNKKMLYLKKKKLHALNLKFVSEQNKVVKEKFCFRVVFNPKRNYRPIEQQTKVELNTCLQRFYVSVRQTIGEPFNVSSLKAIPAAIHRFLKNAPINKPWSIVGYYEFKANDTVNAVCKNLKKEGKIGAVVHKTPITSEQLQKPF